MDTPYEIHIGCTELIGFHRLRNEETGVLATTSVINYVIKDAGGVGVATGGPMTFASAGEPRIKIPKATTLLLTRGALYTLEVTNADGDFRSLPLIATYRGLV